MADLSDRRSNTNGDTARTLPWVRIAIVTFNSGDYTQSCLDALAVQTDRDFDVVIIDNCSTDGAIDQLKLPDDRFRLIRNAVNSGFAGGTNLGLLSDQPGHNAPPYVMSVNPDTQLNPDCLAQLNWATQTYPNTDMFSPVLWQSSDKAARLDGAGDTLSAFGVAWRNAHEQALDLTGFPNVSEVFSPTGAAALYRTAAYRREGGLDEAYFCYFEDVDLAMRLRARGGRALLVKSAIGTHAGGHSTNALPGFAVRQTSRNALWSLTTNTPFPLLPIMLSLHVTAHLWFQFRNRGTDLANVRAEGFRSGLKGLPLRFFARFKRRPYPLGASFRLARRLSWSISDVNRRQLVWWSVRDVSHEADPLKAPVEDRSSCRVE